MIAGCLADENGLVGAWLKLLNRSLERERELVEVEQTGLVGVERAEAALLLLPRCCG